MYHRQEIVHNNHVVHRITVQSRVVFGILALRHTEQWYWCYFEKCRVMLASGAFIWFAIYRGDIYFVLN